MKRMAAATILLLLALNAIELSPQNPKATLDGISALGQFRAPFLHVLERALSAQQTRAWNELYKMQWQVAIEHESLQKFTTVREERTWRLLDFRPTRIDTVTVPTAIDASGQWSVLGCALIEEHGRRTTSEGVIPVYLLKGDWFTGEVGLAVDKDAPTTQFRCRLEDGLTLLKRDARQ